MQELNPGALLGAATTLARVHQIFSNLTASYSEPLLPESVALLLPSIENFRSEAEKIGAKLSVRATDRMIVSLSTTPCPLTVATAVLALQDIESDSQIFFMKLRCFRSTSKRPYFSKMPMN